MVVAFNSSYTLSYILIRGIPPRRVSLRGNVDRCTHSNVQFYTRGVPKGICDVSSFDVLSAPLGCQIVERTRRGQLNHTDIGKDMISSWFLTFTSVKKRTYDILIDPV